MAQAYTTSIVSEQTNALEVQGRHEKLPSVSGPESIFDWLRHWVSATCPPAIHDCMDMFLSSSGILHFPWNISINHDS